MDKRDFSYKLPENLIAQEPAKERQMSRLMVMKKTTGDVSHRFFSDICEYLNPGDCIVLNDTRVMPARLYGRRADTGGKIEFVLVRRVKDDDWEVMVKPGRRAKPGTRFVFGEKGELHARVLDIVEQGNRIVRFRYEGEFSSILEKTGIMPLPPYIKKPPENPERYQTVYSRVDGSAAAPTAGLHFTDEILLQIQKKGVSIIFLTLHVGPGTFRPVRENDITMHRIHAEYFCIGREAADKINYVKKAGGKVFAVGTTSCRVLETVGDDNGYVREDSGWTDIFIYPGYSFKVVDALITNFHLPESTLIMLVSAFAGRENVMNAYELAIEKKYRFYSFGDAMLLV